MKRPHQITRDHPEVMSIYFYDDCRRNYVGLCLVCKAPRDQVEPDAEGYLCECCDSHAVMGIEDMLMRGLINIIEDE